jgi:hypothetical protein
LDLQAIVYLDDLNKEISKNYDKLSLSEKTLQQIGVLNQEKDRKEKMLNTSGLLNNRFLSFYLMELSNSLPKNISFSSIAIRPVRNEIKKNFKIDIEQNVIYVMGESMSSNILSKWIKDLKLKDWIGNVDILNYFYTKGRGEFELKIEILNV